MGVTDVADASRGCRRRPNGWSGCGTWGPITRQLAQIDSTLADLTDQLGTGVFTRGTPQRARLDARIAALAARQSELSAEAVKPARWTWKRTGQRFADWWEAQDVTARNVWLRSMNVRLTFDRERFYLDLGDIYKLTEQMTARGPVAEWQEFFDYMRDNGIQGVTIGIDGTIAITPKGLSDEEEAAAAGVLRLGSLT